MTRRARTWIALGLAAVVTAAIVGSRACGREDARAPRPGHSRALDVAGFRAELAERLVRAKALAARPRAEPIGAPQPPTRTWPNLGKGAIPNAGTGLIEPQCILGPRELCALLDGLVRSCDAGGARDCLAVGQYLADTPPRPMIATTFFMQACRIGDAAGCERLDELNAPSRPDCQRDPLACGLAAMRTQDEELTDQACTFGVADACSFMAWFTKDDVERSRAYYERACQLGLSGACADLGHRLQPGCVASEYQPCYPPDPVAARAALEIGCAAGWASGDDCR